MIKRILLDLYFLLRLPFLWIILLIFAARPVRKKDISRILMIRPDRIGDLVVSLPVIKNIKTQYPQARLDILVRPYTADLARLDSDIDNVLVYYGFFKTAKLIRSRGYDIAIDMLLDHKIKTAVLAYICGAAVRAGFAWGFREVFFTHAVSAAAVKGKSMAGAHLELPKILDIGIKYTVPEISLPLRKPQGVLTVCVAPGGYYESQRWSKDSFAAVIRSIVGKYSAQVNIIASPAEKELADYIVVNAKSASVKAVLPKTCAELVLALAQCDLVICNNSGPLHIAAALGIPTVSTMGPTDPVLWQPAGEKNIVIRKGLGCSPCSKAVCAKHECLETITPEEVFRAAEDSINRFVKRQV